MKKIDQLNYMLDMAHALAEIARRKRIQSLAYIFAMAEEEAIGLIATRRATAKRSRRAASRSA